MQHFPLLYTPRLLLRKLQVDDVPALAQLANNKKISDHILNMPHPYGEPDAVFRISYVHQGFVNQLRYVFAIVCNESETEIFMGEVALHLDAKKKIAQLAYWIGEPYWNQGYATEAINALLSFGFGKLELDLVFADCHEENTASVRVLEKNGFTKAGQRGGVLQYLIKKDTPFYDAHSQTVR
jgi:[ribosomal protein S5]-alanine N-acetyltransferase